MPDIYGGRDEIPREFTDSYWAEYVSRIPEEGGPVPSSPLLAADSAISRPLRDRMGWAGNEPIGVVIELNDAWPGRHEEARDVTMRSIERHAASSVQEFGPYIAVALPKQGIVDIAQMDIELANHMRDAFEHSRPPDVSERAQHDCRGPIRGLWPNFEIHGLINRTAITTKSIAAQRAFGAYGEGITWAVVDSGIEAKHSHFTRYSNLSAQGSPLNHRSFVGGSVADALTDEAGHGTHVAGIIAGEDTGVLVARSHMVNDVDRRVALEKVAAVSGMAPKCSLLSLKVLRSDQSGDVIALIKALQFLRQFVQEHDGELPVHGVNLSVGYPFDPSWFGTGQTPVCREVDALVRAGLVVVSAAGNTGCGMARGFGPRASSLQMGVGQTINDPGNAEAAITVGSTSASPYHTGVSYFSSKGPTGDGRPKPDLVAPGERVVSAAAGKLREDLNPPSARAPYAENSGTSMAAPHVSGIAAAFLSVHTEFIGRPEEVKQILLRSAVDLGRSRDFQGDGLVDAMSAIQSV
jgi:subtilisin family serine protease